VIMKNAAFCDVAPPVSKRLTLFSLADFSTLKMEATLSSETSVHTRPTRRHIPEDGTLQNYSYAVEHKLF
jgi:hypothetical protein